MPLPTACFHFRFVNIPRTKQCGQGWACVLACATLSSAGILEVAREPPLTPYHVHGNAITLCDVAVVVVVFVFAAVLTVDAQVC
jgi:hypothetical protein